jgi:hypothetical protein
MHAYVVTFNGVLYLVIQEVSVVSLQYSKHFRGVLNVCYCSIRCVEVTKSLNFKNSFPSNDERNNVFMFLINLMALFINAGLSLLYDL